MDVGSLLVADAQSAKLVEPSEASLYNPSPSPRPAAVLWTVLAIGTALLLGRADSLGVHGFVFTRFTGVLLTDSLICRGVRPTDATSCFDICREGFAGCN